MKRAKLLIFRDSVYPLRAFRFFSGVTPYAIVERRQDSRSLLLIEALTIFERLRSPNAEIVRRWLERVEERDEG